MLSYIRRHLFDPDLSVGRMKRACGVRDNGISTAFRQAIGRSPRVYIADRRLETAARMLRDTDVEIWRLGEILGYSSLPVFSRAFSRWCGERPSAYRARVRRQRGGRRPGSREPRRIGGRH
ncbi:MAG: AraC family transcriptional regulator, partial [Acidobacteria bacterium]